MAPPPPPPPPPPPRPSPLSRAAFGLVALLAALPATAVSPDGVELGREPARTRRVHVERQHALRHSPGWLAFTAAEGAGWQATFDEWTGLPWKAWGPGLPVDDRDEGALRRSVEQLLGAHPALVGGQLQQLRFSHAIHQADRDAWILRWEQVVPGEAWPAGGPAALAPDPEAFGPFAAHGQPVVWRGGVDARVQDGRLTLLSVKVIPEAAGVGGPSLGAAAAAARAVADGPARGSTAEGAALVVVPSSADGDPAPRLAWMVHSATPGRPDRWISFIDARSGERLWAYNQTRYLAGTLSGEHEERTHGDPMVVSPLVGLEVSGGSADVTDAAGGYSVSGSTATARFADADLFPVYNSAGAEASLSWTTANPVWTSANATQPEISTYVFLTQVQAWAEAHAADVSITSSGIRGNVNLNSTCNAYYDGSSANFYVAGDGCTNTGQIKDVVFHEWGHGLHYEAARSSYVDGGLSEGAGDIVSMLETNDAIMAPGFTTDGSGIRNLAPNRRYPEDITGQVHTDGLIFGGAVWDLVKLLEARDGWEAASAIVSTRFVDVLQTNPEIADSYDEFVVADDDDGDLSNGTPNICELIAAFGEHGLGPAGAGAGTLNLSHLPLDNQPASAAEYPVVADLRSLAPDCEEGSATGAVVRYSTDGGATWEEAPLDLAGDGVEGAIPAQPPGSIVDYYVVVETDGGEVSAPIGGEITPFSFAVGSLTELRCWDFEDDDGGFTHELVDGTNNTGADDWMWGTPRGYANDPDFAYSGDKVWGNDLGGRIDGEDWNGEYQDDKHNRLSSPEVDLEGHAQVVLQYRRWLRVEDGAFDKAQILANGEPVWANFASDRDDGSKHHAEAQWALHTVALPPGLDAVTLSWEIISDGGLTFGGWNIDDVCLYALDDAPAAGDSGDSGEPGGADGGADGGDPDGDGGALSDPTIEGGKVTACSCGVARNPASGLLGLLGAFGFVAARRRRR